MSQEASPRSVPLDELVRYAPTLKAAVSQLQARAREKRAVFDMATAEQILELVAEVDSLRRLIQREARDVA